MSAGRQVLHMGLGFVSHNVCLTPFFISAKNIHIIFKSKCCASGRIEDSTYSYLLFRSVL